MYVYVCILSLVLVSQLWSSDGSTGHYQVRCTCSYNLQAYYLDHLCCTFPTKLSQAMNLYPPIELWAKARGLKGL